MAVGVKQPKKKGIANVPVVMQLEALECGAACLCMIMAYYKKWVPLEQVRLDCGVSRDGSTAKNVIIAARGYGFEAAGYKFEVESLKSEGIFPCIIHWNFNHFVVLNGFKGNKAYLNDPARGTVKVSMEEFDKAFTGICLLITPSDSFKPSGKNKSTLDFAKKRLRGTGKAVAFVAITTIITYFFGVINPIMQQILVDRLLTRVNPSWISPFLILLALFALVQIVSAWISAVYSLKIRGKMAIIGSTQYMWKVFRLPMEFFSQRLAGDIMERCSTNENIAETLVNTVAPLILNSFMAVFYLVIMLKRSVPLTMIGLVTITCNLLVSRYISARRVNISRVRVKDEASLVSATYSGFTTIETIKASGAENGFFQKWAGFQALVNSQNVKYQKSDIYLGMIPAFLNTVSSYLVLVCGVSLVIDGHFSLGMIISFQSFLNLFMGPANQLIGAGQTIQEMRTQMELVGDVLDYPTDEYCEIPEKEDEDYRKLSGNIEIKNLTFGYSKLSEPLIKDFNLSIQKGSRIAIVGESGSGKSTLSKLISGLYKPWNGEISFDGKKIGEISRSIFTGSVAVVDQDIILFEDTIAANIKMWDDSIEDFEMILAARDAQIHGDIIKREGGYNYRIANGGLDLSGGQRQRLEIARVLAQDPSIIILDEATSALDAKTEHAVVEAIKNRGITCIVIAHRLSTIRDCDNIIVLENGKIAEQGRFEELIGKGGAFTELVTNE